MSHCYYHALSSVKRWGGHTDDYLPLHQWFDESKKIVADPRHRALRHHAEGIFMLETVFGVTIRNADGCDIPVRLIGEQHVQEDLGRIPSFADWARLIQPMPWILRGNPAGSPGLELSRHTSSAVNQP
ncbi:DUF6915 family protein [Novosphingobium album (ex Liu et al. 2023)]|uniref:DUF6915 domain-containing protein n=1 Tax=Novosphingobium album (ex Liu et al. 2023) TaxID=3031130 RepID=A0ABT5WLK0_9SPHN|nr:hypothetical protein [Novosphingobium album (ex Liu et al. 2023)]MDE8650591.1 hypothetical protein [Novosphingobium album (ex Liu et al. 2023)]